MNLIINHTSGKNHTLTLTIFILRIINIMKMHRKCHLGMTTLEKILIEDIFGLEHILSHTG